MALIISEVFADAVNEKLGVALKMGQLAVDCTNEVADITTCGDRVHFPKYDRVASVGAVTKGTAVTPTEVSMTDNVAEIKQTGGAIRVYDKDEKQIKGATLDNMAVQLADAMAKDMDTSLSDTMDAEATKKSATANASAITNAELMDGLRILARSGVELTTSPYQLYKALTENEPTRRELSNIVDGLKILDEEGVITILNDEENKGRKNTYTIDAQGIELDGSKTFYFSVPIEYIYKIMDEKSKPFALLHYYIFLCSTINAIKHIGEHSQENILEHFPFLKLSLRTLQRRHKRLAELKVICFSESKSAIGADGNFVNVHKSYCMPEYEHLLGDNQKKKIAKGVKESAKTGVFSIGIVAQLIPIMNEIEQLLSKMSDSVTTLSMNPMGVVTGQRLDESVHSDLVGATLNLEEGGTFDWATANLDYNSITSLDKGTQPFVVCDG